MKREEVLKKLKEDDNYYGSFGKQYLSASNVRDLLFKPTDYGKLEKTLPLIQGGYFHTLMLEPEKLNTYHVLDVRTRNNKEFTAYKNDNNLHQYDILLSHEVAQINTWADKLKANFDIHDMIYDSENQFEIPEITEIHGLQWKGKCDILGKNFVYDLKTSSNIHKFRWSCKEYCYDSQAYIYQTLFNKPMKFIVIDKSSLEIKVAECSDQFIESGRQKVEDAVKQFKKFFKKDAEYNIDDFVYEETL